MSAKPALLWKSAIASICMVGNALAQEGLSTLPDPNQPEHSYHIALAQSLGQDHPNILLVPAWMPLEEREGLITGFVESQNLAGRVTDDDVSMIAGLDANAKELPFYTRFNSMDRPTPSVACVAVGDGSEVDFAQFYERMISANYGETLEFTSRVNPGFIQNYNLMHETMHCLDYLHPLSLQDWLREHIGGHPEWDDAYYINIQESIADVATAIALVNASANKTETLRQLQVIADIRILETIALTTYRTEGNHDTGLALLAVLEQLRENPNRYEGESLENIITNARTIAYANYPAPPRNEIEPGSIRALGSIPVLESTEGEEYHRGLWALDSLFRPERFAGLSPRVRERLRLDDEAKIQDYLQQPLIRRREQAIRNALVRAGGTTPAP